MPGRVPIDPFVSAAQTDLNFHSEGEFNAEGTISPTVYIPRSKHKKSKNRRRHSDTIWTIVQEQETPSSSRSPKHKSSKSGSKHHTKETSKHKTSKENKKTSKSIGKIDPQRKSSFLDNPVYSDELKNWTLPRAELWCRDPNCQINVQLWTEYCHSHQDQLTQLQVQELLQHQQHHHHHHHRNNHHQSLPPQHQPIASKRSQRLSSNSFANYIYDDSVDNSHSVPQVLCNESGAGSNVDGASSNPHNHECPHPFHNDEEEQYYYHRQTSHGNMQINMSIGASRNNLSAQPAPNASVSAGLGTFSPSTNNSNSSKSYNNINHPPPPPPLPPSSVIISIPSGVPSNNTNNSNSVKTISTSASVGQHQQVTSSTGGEVGGAGSTRGDFTGSSYCSSSSASGTDVSSGSTFVTGFDSSESRMSSVPSSMSKPPHPNIRMDSNNHRTESHSYNNTNHNNHSKKVATQTSDHVIGYGDSTNTATGGYPSLPYMPQSGHRKTGICPSCNGLVPPPTNHHLVPVDPVISNGAEGPHQHKSDNAFWNFTKFQHPLQRDHSFHSVGGFTLNGQYNTQVKKRRVVKFCSSHKIALVVSTFSLMVTVGLIITLILMKKRGMMDTMDMMPT